MTGHVASSMGTDKTRYLVFLNGRWRWRPTRTMRAAGFRMINLGAGTEIDGRRVPSVDDRTRATQLNEDWDRHRRGLPAKAVASHRYPPGSIGDAYHRAMQLRAAERIAKNITWTSEQHSRDEWPRAWKWIDPLFGDCDPKFVTPEQLIGNPRDPATVGLRPLVAAKVSESEAHRVIQIWRSLWKKMAVFGYCELERDPSLMFANSAPDPRQAVWSEGEAVRLVKYAWRSGYSGLAVLLAVAWDSQLSPIDTRRLSKAQLRQDAVGLWFAVERAKTGRTALATLGRRTVALLSAYLAGVAAEPIGAAPLFRNRSGRPYSKDTLGDDFRAVRRALFGADELRQLADFRRSGSTEALAGDAEPGKLSSKMANSLSTSNRLHKTYSPVMLAAVRETDAARQRGRAKLREQNPDESVTAPDQKVSRRAGRSAKPLK